MGEEKKIIKEQGEVQKHINNSASLAVHYASSRFYGWLGIFERDRWNIPDVGTTETECSVFITPAAVGEFVLANLTAA
jgi:hypothetical protein